MLQTLWEQTWYWSSCPSLLLNCPQPSDGDAENKQEKTSRDQRVRANGRTAWLRKGLPVPRIHIWKGERGLGKLVHTGNPSAEELETARPLGSLASQPALFSKSQARSQKFKADVTWEMTPEVVPWPTALHTCQITEAGGQILRIHKLTPNTPCPLKTDNI